MPSVSTRGVELTYWEAGPDAAPAVLCLHETGTSGDVWRPLAGELGDAAHLVAPDRRGWRGSSAPEGYRATTVEEQSEDAASLLAALGHESAVLCGAGIGAVAVLDLALREPDRALGAVLVEPPILAFAPGATESLSADRLAIEMAVAEGGPRKAVAAYLSGGLPVLGPGAKRLPPGLTEPARERPGALFAELGAVAAWRLPAGGLWETPVAVAIAVSASTPGEVRAACEGLAGRLAGAELLDCGGEGPPHLGAPDELAAAIRSLQAARRTGTS